MTLRKKSNYNTQYAVKKRCISVYKCLYLECKINSKISEKRTGDLRARCDLANFRPSELSLMNLGSFNNSNDDNTCSYRITLFSISNTVLRYFNGHCSQEIRDIIPVPLRRVRTTRSSTHSHPFQVSLPNPRTLSHKSSFIPRTCNLWNVLPSSCFPESYNLPSFKSKINKLDLISLSF